jgi:aspartate aminotransferase
MTKLSHQFSQISESQTVALSGMMAELKRNGVDVVALGAGEPDFDTPDSIKEAAITAIHKGYTKYTPADGIFELKQAITEWLADEYGAEYDPSQIVITCGAKHAVYQAIAAVCNPDDQILLPAPYWVSYPEQIKLAGAHPVILPAKQEQGFKVTPEQLESALNDRIKLIILNNPSNPTGAVYSETELKSLIDVLASKSVFVLADEIYDKIVFKSNFVSMLKFSSIRERLLLINGVSKSFAMTGWRIGFLAADKRIIAGIRKFQGHTTSNPASVSQYAALQAYRGDKTFIAKMVAEFAKRREYLYDRLMNIAGIECVLPQGAFYFFPDVSAFFEKKGNGQPIKNSLQLCRYLLQEHKVGVVPGSAFGMDTHVRLSFATSMEILEKAMDRIEEGLNALQ